jgi:hypothetical protein
MDNTHIPEALERNIDGRLAFTPSSNPTHSTCSPRGRDPKKEGRKRKKNLRTTLMKFDSFYFKEGGKKNLKSISSQTRVVHYLKTSVEYMKFNIRMWQYSVNDSLELIKFTILRSKSVTPYLL